MGFSGTHNNRGRDKIACKTKNVSYSNHNPANGLEGHGHRHKGFTENQANKQQKQINNPNPICL